MTPRFLPLSICLAVLFLCLSPLDGLAVDIGSMTWTPRPDWINVKNCSAITGVPNAVGDGTTDDTAAIQAALNVVSGLPIAGGNAHPDGHGAQTVYFPPGTYKISRTLTWDKVYEVALIGCGNRTTIEWAGEKGAAMFHPNNIAAVLYKGFIWDGMNMAGCAFEQYSPDGHYDGNIRHENESFRNFTQPGTYLFAGHAPVPGAAIAGGFKNQTGYPSLQADSMICNCRFYNCSTGFYNCYEFGNNTPWVIDGCEFDDCGTGLNFIFGADGIVTQCHFQNSKSADITSLQPVRMRNCTSQGSACFYNETGGSFTQDVIQDCWVDGWTNPAFAVHFGGVGGQMVMDSTFTHAPPKSAGVIFSNPVWGDLQQIVFSNNYAPDFGNGLALINAASSPIFPLVVPAGTRRGTLTSPAQTFLNSADFTDSTHIIDVTQAPYNANNRYTGDASAGIQAALKAAQEANNGTIVYLPYGIYKVGSPLSVSGGNYTIQGPQEGGAELCWTGAEHSTVLTLSNPASVVVDSLRFAVLDNTITGIQETAAAPNHAVFKEVTYNSYQGGNPRAGGADVSNGPGLVLSNLPAGCTVFLDHLLAPLTVQDCGPALITARFLQNGAIRVSGASAPKTGMLGVMFAEGGNYAEKAAGYNITVDDDQNLVLDDDYTEQAYNDMQLLGGKGTSPGSVTFSGFCTSEYHDVTHVKIDNYAGRLFVGPQSYYNGDSKPSKIIQTGSSPIDLIFTDTAFGGGAPVITADAGAHVLLEENMADIANRPSYLDNSPTNLAGRDLVSFAVGLDPVRQLGAVDLAGRFGLATDAPPLAAYAFEGDTTDMTGQHNGTNHGVTFVDGEVGAQAGCFNGNGSYVSIPKPANGTFSISMWVRTTDDGGTGSWREGHGLVDGRDAGASSDDFGAVLAGGKFVFGLGHPDATLASSRPVNDGKWHYLVAAWNSSNGVMQLYVDGRIDAQGTGPVAPRAGASGLRIGGNSGLFKGAIDRVEIYDYVLSAAAVADSYNRARVAAPLAAWWKLDETAGPASADSSGNQDAGTWQNDPSPAPDCPPQLAHLQAGSLAFTAAKSQEVDMGNPRNLPLGRQARTLCAWARGDGMTGAGTLAAFGTAAHGQGMWIGANGASLTAGAGDDDLPAVPGVWDDQWHFICLTYDGTEASLYVDGALKGTAKKSWNLVPKACYIGCSLKHDAFWNGKVADVRIYNRCLDATDAARLATEKSEE